MATVTFLMFDILWYDIDNPPAKFLVERNFIVKAGRFK